MLFRSKRAWQGALFLFSWFLLAPAFAGPPPKGDLNAGARFYRSGLTRDGKTVPVYVQGDVRTTSNRFPCVACHRPSGFGSSEGGQYTPIIIAPVLFHSRKADQLRRNRHFRDLFKETQGSNYSIRVRMPRMRPAYDADTLARAIRTGVDSAGRTMSKTMPRYQLDDQEVADLIAYLRTLSAKQSPGVSKKEIHLATIFSDNVAPTERAAVLRTLDAFIAWYNQNIGNEIHRPGFSPYYLSEFRTSFRKWKLHVWTLRGPRNTWRKQLHEYYARQPVFAEVSGVVNGPWQPIDAFCEAEKLPCVFPNTDLPVTEHATYGYSIYFSGGLALEGEALAKYLGQQDHPPTKIYEIHMDGPAGNVPAAAFAKAAKRYLPAAGITAVTVRSAKRLSAAIATAAAAPVDTLIIWPGAAADAAVRALNSNPPAARRIVLPSTSLPSVRERLSADIAKRVRLTYRFDKPTAYHSWQYEVRAWFDTRRVKVTYPRLQFQTWYALTEMQYSIGDLVDDFYRDYLIEFIEHEAEEKVNPGMYPSLALGPGQRFASKGAYIVKLDRKARGGIVAVSDWVVP